ncbi:cytidylyltransferase domain-containing protein [Marinovum sp. F03]|uniref:cytidylyltransferase domain-containing protein n=1 Tax=Marinovum sp. F03 TaxID=3449226 RepID=UPI003EDC3D9E
MQIALIPARGGSKRIPRKNIRPLRRPSDDRLADCRGPGLGALRPCDRLDRR